jgi:hypothetical protein
MKGEIGKQRSESEIVGILKQKVFGSDSYNQSELASQRQSNYNMYYLNPLGNEEEGRSKIQSADVFDAVEGTKAVMHEALTSGRELLHFDPQSEDDVDMCKMANRYVKDRFYENNGYRFLIDTLHDGLLAKNAVCKYFWVEDIEKSYEQFTGLNATQFKGMVSQPNIEVYDYQAFESVDPQTGMPFQVFSGTVEVSEDKSHVGFRLLKPEDYFGDESAESMETSTFGSDRDVLRKGELIEDYPHLEKEIKNSPMYVDSRREQDDLVRRSNDDSWRTDSQDERALEREPVEVHDCFIYLWGTEGYGIYQFKMIGQKYLLWDWPKGEDGEPLEELPEDFEPADGVLVDDLPYLQWSPYPLSHRWDGLAQADSVRDIQLTTTNLKRSIIDHTMRTNNPMREANLEFIRNPEDLIDNVIGAVIDKEMAAGTGPCVTAIDQPQLSPTSFATLEMLKQESESRSSYSRLAGGINGDAIGKQNSKDMIDGMTDSSNRRIMMMTRNLVEMYLKPLYLKVYELGVKHDQRTYNVEVSGNWVEMSPQQWQDRHEMKVVTSMTPEAAMQSAMNKMTVHGLVSADPEAMLMYPEQKRFNMYAEIFRDIGEMATDRFLENPASEEYQQAQMEMLKGQQQQQQMAQQMQQMAQQMQEMQMQLQQKTVEATIDQGQQKLDNDAYSDADKQSLAEDTQEHKEDIDEAELLLEAEKIAKGVTTGGVAIG